MAPSSALPRPDFAEVLLRIPLLPERPLFTEWLTDALSTELDQESSVVDDVEDAGFETFIYLHGTNARHMVQVARQILLECGRIPGIRIIETQPRRREEGFAA